MKQKQFKLTAKAFAITSCGEVVINNKELAQLLDKLKDNPDVEKSGIVLEVAVPPNLIYI